MCRTSLKSSLIELAPIETNWRILFIYFVCMLLSRCRDSTAMDKAVTLAQYEHTAESAIMVDSDMQSVRSGGAQRQLALVALKHNDLHLPSRTALRCWRRCTNFWGISLLPKLRKVSLKACG